MDDGRFRCTYPSLKSLSKKCACMSEEIKKEYETVQIRILKKIKKGPKEIANRIFLFFSSRKYMIKH